MWSRLSGDQIRILDILPHGGTDDTLSICCDITVVALSNKLQYDAVSYCWGESNATVNIEVAGNPRSITTNLHAALRHLQLPDRKRSVWIDQLCLNQDDNEERLSQVHLMYDVYSQCSRCLVWLGEIDPESSVEDAKVALDLILFISDKNKKALIPTSISSTNTPTFKIYLRALASVGYAKNSWWKRIWTVQEAILPSEILFHWGPLQIPWGSVVGALYPPIYKRFLMRPLLYQHSLLETWPLADYINDQHAIMFWIQKEHICRDSAFDAAIRWRGHMTNYETSVAELYTAFTIDIILDENSLALLALDPRVERGKRTSNIPNWATDMNDSVEYGVDRYYRRWGDKQIYNASGETRLDKQTLIDATADPNHHFNVLGLTGIMIDTVDVLPPCFGIGWISPQPEATGNFSDEAFHRLVIGNAMRDNEQGFRRRLNADDLRQVADFVRDGTRDDQWLQKKIMRAGGKAEVFRNKRWHAGIGSPGNRAWGCGMDI
ncbi:hypothetical protein BTUL_0065g00320 [Botrytis tulipae]|uniref:Heterokaryon incompatibility domain-containing protein n=1 Tax=Botrytis tulipae TaxID=87230 RepID=A0A4Z1EMQ0_9HELO|nr:hypothetical protein BTUL_0065g00320 [Botrytis tulipae]